MLGYKGEECAAMCEVLGFLREIEAERGHVIDSMTVVDTRLHTQQERGLISQTDKTPHVCECPKFGQDQESLHSLAPDGWIHIH